MPYLPPRVYEQTVLPAPIGPDFWLQVNLIAEKWKRVFPVIPYQALLKQVTPETTTDGSVPVGTPGTTIYDPIYGESVDPAMLADGWQQPNLSGTLEAADVELYAAPVNINMRIHVEASDELLHAYGFDEVRDLLVEVPCSILDEVGVTATEGDKFSWGGLMYRVLKIGYSQRFRNQSFYVYVGMNCESWRTGS